MSKRIDGKITKKKILKAACKIFAKKGFKATRIAEICKEAGVNVAAVNYYFGDKVNLYRESFKYAYREYIDPYVKYPKGASLDEKIKIYIEHLVKNFIRMSKKGYFIRFYLMELSKPTGLIDDLWKELIEPKRKEFLEIIKEFMGKDKIDQEVLFCEVSIVSQCKMIINTKMGFSEFLFGEPFSDKLVKKIVEHITNFSFGGMERIRKYQKD